MTVSLKKCIQRGIPLGTSMFFNHLPLTNCFSHTCQAPFVWLRSVSSSINIFNIYIPIIYHPVFLSNSSPGHLSTPGGSCTEPHSCLRSEQALLFTQRGGVSPDGHSTWKDHIITARSSPTPQVSWEAVYSAACFCVSSLQSCSREHRENMQTPHRRALSPTPPRVWVPMIWRSRHTLSTHSVPSGN